MTESNHVRGSFWTVLCIPILYNSDITLGKRVMDQIRDFGLRTSAGDSSGEILQKKNCIVQILQGAVRMYAVALSSQRGKKSLF